ncbi:MAG TPA: prolyl oligopeptidase family serine peptidase [Acidimicrobiales bacterium]
MTPYGSWTTPITSELVVRAAASLGSVAVDGDSVWWSELRPEEGGRTQVVHKLGDGPAVDLLPAGFNARTAVHEYGGGAWWVRGHNLWFANWEDQRLYRLTGRAMPIPVTPDPEAPRGDRWADGQVDASGRWLVVVREHHPPGRGPAEVVNEIVVLDGSGELEPCSLVSGPDFVSDPRLSPDGGRLCWLQWNHPDMPWDGTELMVAQVEWVATGPQLGTPIVVAGRPHRAPAGPSGRGSGEHVQGEGESVFQPRWHRDGSLWFVSDRTGWGNLYRWVPADDGGEVEPRVQMEAEIGVPQWVFGQSRYAFLDDGRVVFAYQRDGLDHLAVEAPDGSAGDLDIPYTAIASIEAMGDGVVFIGASAVAEPAVVRVPLRPAGDEPGGAKAGEPEILRPPRDLGLDPTWFSVPEPIAFPTTGGRTAHALFYPPTNPNAVGPGDGQKPPLLVFIHGGPTAAARPMLQLGIQYWTSRGFAVADVNYGGSTGYGREYVHQLDDNWGVIDLDDCVAAARWLAERGRVDPDRLAIRGGSAGGYTTLAALAFRDTFAAGASHFGVADLEALATETHKFESRYLDGLIGPYPERRDLYVERSPIHHVEGFDRPLIVLQGLEDEVVPPNQAEMIVDALRTKGVPVAYVTFEGEQHGFRQAANIRRALDAELSFYGQVFGFDLPEDEGIEPVTLENL